MPVASMAFLFMGLTAKVLEHLKGMPSTDAGMRRITGAALLAGMLTVLSVQYSVQQTARMYALQSADSVEHAHAAQGYESRIEEGYLDPKLVFPEKIVLPEKAAVARLSGIIEPPKQIPEPPKQTPEPIKQIPEQYQELDTEKNIEAKAVITQGVKNFMLRLIWTETAPYAAHFPESDYRRAIENVIGIIDNRVNSGLFSNATALGVISAESQWQGLQERDGFLMKGNMVRTDIAGIEELVARYNAANNPVLVQQIQRKRDVIEQVIEAYANGTFANPLPKNAVFFKNDGSPDLWGNPVAADPVSLAPFRNFYFPSHKIK